MEPSFDLSVFVYFSIYINQFDYNQFVFGMFPGPGAIWHGVVSIRTMTFRSLQTMQSTCAADREELLVSRADCRVVPKVAEESARDPLAIRRGS